jgi:hypothetical protein
MARGFEPAAVRADVTVLVESAALLAQLGIVDLGQMNPVILDLGQRLDHAQ